MTPTPKQNAKRVIELSEKATKGPWEQSHHDFQTIRIYGPNCEVIAECPTSKAAEFTDNSRLIYALRTAAPELARAYLTLETELQQLRLAADGMRELAVSFQGLLDKAQVAPGVQPGSDTFTRYNITTNGRDLERMKELIQSKIAAYRAAGEGSPKDTGTSKE